MPSAMPLMEESMVLCRGGMERGGVDPPERPPEPVAEPPLGPEEARAAVLADVERAGVGLAAS
ncbi:MAG: hypothetical protein ACK550_11815 [Synechococcaceae cyanobacterium]